MPTPTGRGGSTCTRRCASRPAGRSPASTARPNPSRPGVTPYVSFAVPASLQGEGSTVKVYTQDGQFIRELRGLAWDGKNADGGAVASGTYVFVFSSSRGTGRARFAVIR